MRIHSNLADKNSQIKLRELLNNFNVEGKLLVDGDRNTLKIFNFFDKKLTVKSFKVPNAVNQIAYRFFRKSKAQRSFEYATRLLKMDVGTPVPVAYAEAETSLFTQSYYVCEYLDYDLTYRELVDDSNYADDTEIIKAFTRFTFDLHEKGIHFLDHSPGNTLIKKIGDDYNFYLVDLNRMEFKPMDFNTRIKNFSRLTPKKNMIVKMGREYARLIGKDEKMVIDAMWEETEKFQEKFKRKQQLKKKLKFWKN